MTPCLSHPFPHTNGVDSIPSSSTTIFPKVLRCTGRTEAKRPESPEVTFCFQRGKLNHDGMTRLKEAKQENRKDKSLQAAWRLFKPTIIVVQWEFTAQSKKVQTKSMKVTMGQSQGNDRSLFCASRDWVTTMVELDMASMTELSTLVFCALRLQD